MGDDWRGKCGICGQETQQMFQLTCGERGTETPLCGWSIVRCTNHGGGAEVDRLLREHLTTAHKDVLGHARATWSIRPATPAPVGAVNLAAMGMPSNEHPVPWLWNDHVTGSDLRDARGKLLCSIAPGASRPVRALLAAAPRMEALLRKLEWSGRADGSYGTEDGCPDCGGATSRGPVPEEIGHRPDCELGALLAELDAAKRAPTI